MSKNGSSAVIEQTVLIIEKIFASQKVEIFIESHMEFNNIIALSEHNIYPIDNKSGLKLGEVNLKHVNLSEANIEVLNLLLSAMVEHLDCLDNCTKLELHQVNMANILFATNNELEDVYEDLNLAHEELNEVFNSKSMLQKTISRLKSQMKGFFDEAPIAFGILRNRNLRIEVANRLILQVWGRTDAVIGQDLGVAIPELEGQPYLKILDNIFLTGERFIGKELR